MIIALLIGFSILFSVSLYRGNSLKEIYMIVLPGIYESLIVIGILVLIGCLTGLWRLNGTVACFVIYGIDLMPPSLFIIASFLLSAVMSYAIGTSFGVVATAGVILMSIARAGGINPLPVAGAVMSGLYVGDRGSPAASSASLVAAVTKTDVRDNVRKMLQTSFVPFLITCALYLAVSFLFPAESAEGSTVTSSLSDAFRVNWICILPALLMIVLPFARVPVKLAMALDILVSIIIAIAVQNASFIDCLRSMVLGYEPADPALHSLLSGGGIRSMLEVCCILLISGTYGGLFKSAGLMDRLDPSVRALAAKTGRFPAMCLLSIGCCAIFCNQTIGVIMVNQFSKSLYGEAENQTRMIDLEDTVIVIAGLVPWCIACSVPLTTMGTGLKTLLFSFYLWLIPLWNLVFGKR